MKDIKIIIDKISDILALDGKESPDQIGSYIIGATEVQDDIEKYYKKYPLLNLIADMAWELETIKDDAHAGLLLERIEIIFGELKKQVAKE